MRSAEENIRHLFFLEAQFAISKQCCAIRAPRISAHYYPCGLSLAPRGATHGTTDKEKLRFSGKRPARVHSFGFRCCLTFARVNDLARAVNGLRILETRNFREIFGGLFSLALNLLCYFPKLSRISWSWIYMQSPAMRILVIKAFVKIIQQISHCLILSSLEIYRLYKVMTETYYLQCHNSNELYWWSSITIWSRKMTKMAAYTERRDVLRQRGNIAFYNDRKFYY